MPDSLSDRYAELLTGSYDCVDRIVLNAFFRMGHGPGGFRVWWQALTGSEETFDNTHLMRLAGRFSRRIHGYAKANGIPVVHCPAGERKHEFAEEYLAKTNITQGLFLILVGRAQAPVWDVSANHHIEPKRPMPYVNHYSFYILDPEWGHITIKICGRDMDQVFQALIDRSRVLLDLQTVKTILGYQRRPKFHWRKKNSAQWEVAVEKPAYDLTIFKLHCGKLTLKIYTKGERLLRIEVVVHNTQELQCGHSLEKFPRILMQAKGILDRFMDALSCIDQCFIADSMLEELPAPSSVGKTKVGGIDLNKARIRWVVEAVIALSISPSSQGFTASELARQVRLLSNQAESDYGPRRAAYDLKKLRAKNIVQRIGQTRRYQSTSSGLRAMVALVVLRNKALKPLLAAAQRRRKSRGAQNPSPIDKHYETIRMAMQGVFDDLGLAA